jgi:hypothetical protein
MSMILAPSLETVQKIEHSILAEHTHHVSEPEFVHVEGPGIFYRVNVNHRHQLLHPYSS